MSNLTTCIDCARPISRESTKCPHCGRLWPHEGQKESVQRQAALVPLLVLIPFLLLLAYCATL